MAYVKDSRTYCLGERRGAGEGLPWSTCSFPPPRETPRVCSGVLQTARRTRNTMTASSLGKITVGSFVMSPSTCHGSIIKTDPETVPVPEAASCLPRLASRNALCSSCEQEGSTPLGPLTSSCLVETSIESRRKTPASAINKRHDDSAILGFILLQYTASTATPLSLCRPPA